MEFPLENGGFSGNIEYTLVNVYSLRIEAMVIEIVDLLSYKLWILHSFL